MRALQLLESLAGREECEKIIVTASFGSVSILDFTDIIKELRSEHGCPWDREQTHNSLTHCISEETEELLIVRTLQKTPQSMKVIL